MILRLSIVWKIAAGATLLAFFYLVWPTPYRYDHVRFGSASTVVRTSRLTGNSEVFKGNEWFKVRPAEGPTVNLTSAEIRKLKGEATVDDQGKLKASLYNGTSFRLKEITVEITIHHGKDGKVSFDRLYRMTPDMGGGPFEMADFEADTGREPELLPRVEGTYTVLINPNTPPQFPGATELWKIKSAKGIRVH